METFLAGLALLTISGLVTVAMKYPRGFERLRWPFFVAVIAAIVGLGSYGLGYHHGAAQVFPFVPQPRLPEARSAAAANDIPLWWSLVPIGIYMVLGALAFIRPILGIPDDDSATGDDKDKP